MSTETRWLLVIVASSALAVLAALAETGNALSMVPLLWFLAVIPGLPYVRMVRTDDDPVALGIMACGLSVALAALVAEALLYSHAYSGLTTVLVLAGIAVLGAVIGRLRTPAGDSEPVGPLVTRSEGRR